MFLHNCVILRRGAPKNPLDEAESRGIAALGFCYQDVSLDQEWLLGFFATFGRSE
jgi:hypothetical protein